MTNAGRNTDNAEAVHGAHGADTHARTLAGFREDRHRVRGVEIVSSCCATCELGTDREFSLDAPPLLPHTHCTNPEGCQCRYIAVPADAPLTGTEAPTGYPPLRDVTPAPTIPAHLKTPAAAMIVLGAVVIAFGISVISSTSGGKDKEPMPGPLSQTVAATRAPVAAPVAAPAPVPARAAFARVAERPTPRRDREMEARAASDLRRAEAIDRENDAALRARAVAVQQQAYLQTLLSQQASSFGSASANRAAGRRISASTAAVSN